MMKTKSKQYYHSIQHQFILGSLISNTDHYNLKDLDFNKQKSDNYLGPTIHDVAIRRSLTYTLQRDSPL